MLKSISYAIIITTAAIAMLFSCNGGTGPEDGSGASGLIDHYGRQIYTLTTSATPQEGGYVSRSPDTTRYPSGTEVTVTATAEEGYAFIGWSGASAETTPSIVITMSGNLTLIANFEPIIVADIRYSLTVTQNPGNGGTVLRDPDSTDYAAGTEVTVTASPAHGFRFIGWTGSSQSTNTLTTVTLNSNLTLIANFEEIPTDQYTLTVAWDERHGSVTRDPPATSYIAGTEVNLLATPNTGYSFTGWSGADSSSNAAITITMDGDKELTANFRIKTYTLTTAASPNGSGTVTRDITQDYYAHGTEVTVTATPEAGYTFKEWTDPTVPTTHAVTITMTGDRVLTARFEQLPDNQHTLTVNKDPQTGGTVFVNNTASPGITTHDAGEQVTIKAEAIPGYKFTKWERASSSTNAEITLIMNSSQTLTAYFTRLPYTLTIEASPNAGGTITPASGSAIADSGAKVNISAIANSGYEFIGWTLTSGTAAFANPNSASTTVSLSSDAAISANFGQLFTLTTGVTPSGSGGISLNPNRTSYISGTEVTVTATANPDYIFMGWEEAPTSTNNVITITMNSNQTLTAVFQRAIIDERDNKVYKWVQIGTQRWMAENLNFEADGSVCYNNSPDSCAKYGRLYDWATVMGIDASYNSSWWNGSDVNHQGNCPSGWHIPSDEEWETLVKYVDPNATAGTMGWGDNNAAIKLKSVDGWGCEYCYSSIVGTDEYGFSALPGGMGLEGSFGGAGGGGYGEGRWWNATEYDADRAWSRLMGYSGDIVTRYYYRKTLLYSARCVRDN